MEALHQLIDKNAVELIKHKTSLTFFQSTISSPKAKQPVETYIRSEQSEFFPQGGEIQNGDTGNHQDIPPTRGVGHLNRLQGRLLSHTDTGTIQEIPEIPCPDIIATKQQSAGKQKSDHYSRTSSGRTGPDVASSKHKSTGKPHTDPH